MRKTIIASALAVSAACAGSASAAGFYGYTYFYCRADQHYVGCGSGSNYFLQAKRFADEGSCWAFVEAGRASFPPGVAYPGGACLPSY